MRDLRPNGKNEKKKKRKKKEKGWLVLQLCEGEKETVRVWEGESFIQKQRGRREK
jgi:hypothetical protein